MKEEQLQKKKNNFKKKKNNFYRNLLEIGNDYRMLFKRKEVSDSELTLNLIPMANGKAKYKVVDIDQENKFVLFLR